MTIEAAQQAVANVIGHVDPEKEQRAALGVALHFETMGWSADRLREEILDLRIAMEQAKRDTESARILDEDFDV